MKQDILMATAVLVALPAAAQEDLNVRDDGAVVFNAAGNAGRSLKSSLLHSLGSHGYESNSVHTGRVPKKFYALDLTEEQTSALKKLAVACRDEYRTKSREFYRRRRGEEGARDPNQWRERMSAFNKVRDELKKTYAKRMRDALTEKQRETLAKVDSVLEQWREEEAAIRKAMMLALQKNHENFEKEIGGVLTDKQKKALLTPQNTRQLRMRNGIRGDADLRERDDRTERPVDNNNQDAREVF